MPVPPLLQRLRAIAEVLLADPHPVANDDQPFEEAGNLLAALVPAVREEPGGGRLWLLLVGLTGEFPIHEDIEQVRRTLELADGIAAEHRTLEWALATMAASADAANTIELVTECPIVDVHFTAASTLLTGIQRVVRHTVPRWVERHALRLCTWTPTDTALREATADEQRWMRPDEVAGSAASRPAPSATAEITGRLLVPWHVVMILPEVPMIEHAARLSALARHSGSQVALIGYDCIPMISGELVGPSEHAKFVSYLNVVKHASRVVCISSAAAEEFAGFADALGAQGLSGPSIVACPLPNGPDVGVGVVGVPPPPSAALPTIVYVGSIDRRKNQIVALEAAEQLWREGHRFAVRFMGSGGLAPAEFTEWSNELIEAGRPLTIEAEVSDAALSAAIRAARFTVFLSLHEGFGLPVAESLAMGVPVLTSNVGSLRELAEGDGAVTVDPSDVLAVTDALRRLLTDDALVAELAERARARPRRTWDEYAEQAWTALTTGAAGSTE